MSMSEYDIGGVPATKEQMLDLVQVLRGPSGQLLRKIFKQCESDHDKLSRPNPNEDPRQEMARCYHEAGKAMAYEDMGALLEQAENSVDSDGT